MTLHDLDRDDGFKLVSEQFKIRGNDLLDLYLNHDFTVEIIGALKKIQSREQGASLVTNIRKRARGDDDQANVHLLHHLPCLAVYCCQNISPAIACYACEHLLHTLCDMIGMQHQDLHHPQ